ncbi:hypothetical protein AAES_136312 [Amazona aestiva]|uniref:Uncharacterized protein n=1 Tax=Amazona aestiva TaxID=12930 RepID=A0A0Q3PJE7_AMAAE|nr:hypothetical protein AAES_136312 [Amazona aestiva]
MGGTLGQNLLKRGSWSKPKLCWSMVMAGLLMSFGPAKDQPVPYQLVQGVSGPLGTPEQLLQLPSVVPLPPVAQLPCAHGQEVASSKDKAAVEDCIPTASPHESAPALQTPRTTMKPRAVVTTPAALGEPVEVSEQGPATFAGAFPDQVEDATFNHQITCSDTAGRDDTISDVPNWAAFLHEFPELSEYIVEGGGIVVLHELPELSKCVVEGGYPKEPSVVVGLGDGEDTVPYVPKVPILTSFLNKLPHFLECRAEDSCSVELKDGDNTFFDGPRQPCKHRLLQPSP